MTHHAPTTRAARRRFPLTRPIAAGVRRAFTLVELLIAIGVLALVSIGLAVIFGSIGETVSEGRRISTLNRAAERIENQIRADLERLTRDGYLVIVNRYASEEPAGSTEPNILDDIRLSPRERDGRERRADEIMFFARGDFTSRRTPLVSGLLATANEAAVYYGIGQKRVPDLETRLNDPSNYFFNPFPTDSNLESTRTRSYAPLLGIEATGGAPANPNRYAQDWALVRQVTLLTTPRLTAAVPSEVYQWERDDVIRRDVPILEDSERQIALQPAARTLFNSLSWTDLAAYAGSTGTPARSFDGKSRWWIGDTARFPGVLSTPAQRSLPAFRSSGVVDIAIGSVTDVRRRLLSLAAVGVQPSDYYPPQAIRPYSPRPAAGGQSFDGFNAAWLDPTSTSGTVPTPGSPATALFQPTDTSGLATADVQTLRAWALDSMPSLWDTSGPTPSFLAGVRYEDTPTRLVYEGDEFDGADEGLLARAIVEANQEMLTSQVFVPRVTEFIVEWSYGTVDPLLTPGDPDFRQMQWFGLPRATRDENRDGVIDMDDHEVNPSVRRYSDPVFATEELHLGPGSDLVTSPRSPARIYVNVAPSDNEESPDFAVFGITDPGRDAGPADDVVPDWPRFLRFTISIADPEDQETERTFQFVFAVPGERG